MNTTAAPFLYRYDELARLSRDLPVIERTAAWCEEFLCRPHPGLGRGGSVCPYMPRALAANHVAFTVVRTQGRTRGDIDEAIAANRTAFLAMEPTSGPGALDKAIVVILPDVAEEDAADVVDETHRRLKASFVASGLMIGKFHPRSAQGGLHNPAFRPLRSPVPLLAIRHMVDSDLPFLNRPDDPVSDRIGFLHAYERRFEGAEGSPWAARGQAALGEITEEGR
ncbi:DUF6875 domain-containing protein [Streptomyces sp. NPDC054783]